MKPLFKHPIGKKILIPNEAPSQALELMKEYQRILDDMWLERVAAKYLKRVKTKADLLSAYRIAYLSAKRKNDFRFSDKIRQIASEIGFKIVNLKDGTVEIL